MIVDIDTLASQIDKLSPSTKEKFPDLIENLANHSGKINIYIHYKTRMYVCMYVCIYVCITNYIFPVNSHSGFYFSAVLVKDEKGKTIIQYEEKQ